MLVALDLITWHLQMSFFPLKRKRRSQALHDLQHTARIRLCRALWCPLFTERPCPALSPALISATQWRPGCAAVTSGARQSCSHTFTARRGTTQTDTDSKTHVGDGPCRSGDVIQWWQTKGHVYCERLHQGALYRIFFFFFCTTVIPTVLWMGFHRSGTATWMSAWIIFFIFFLRLF